VPGGSGGLASPRGLAFGPDGDLYVASATGEILVYDGASGASLGVFVDASGNGGGPLDPWGLAFHEGSLFVASFFPTRCESSTRRRAPSCRPSCRRDREASRARRRSRSAQGDLFVTSSGDDSIKRYAGATGAFLGTFVTPGSGGLDTPFDLEFAASPPPVALPSLTPAGGAALTLLVLLEGACGLRRRRTRAGAA